MMLTLSEGKRIVKFARQSIFSPKTAPIKGFEEKRGVFVTIHSFPSNQLRGCVGFVEPTFQLKEAVFNAAKAAAFHDQRFRPLGVKEDFILEVSVLTKPEILRNKSDYLKEIIIGKDGLIVDFAGYSGLLLPVVAVEQSWNAEQFLENTCIKAGLPPNVWKEPGCRIYRFQTQLFSEKTPN
ncbi:TIGR00296 family protein, partial [Candidatus Woesearchaeota archaeon]|nr:TIGR00296 family protein [Candidatus Woesearchaeota archaeon]